MAVLTLRIFVSSPGDVGQERVISSRVIERLQGEFAGYIELQPILWEHEPLRATDHFQSQIHAPSASDIVVCILWSRLGTRLPPNLFARPDGTPYSSGTEWEFEDAAAAFQRHGKPDLLVYRKTTDPLISTQDERALERLEQKRALDQFIDRWFGNPYEGFKAAFTSFQSPDEFEDLLEKHLRKLIKERLPDRITNEGEEAIRISWYKGTPYRGLEAFDMEHASVFFGRTRAIGAVKEALISQAASGCAFVLVFGMSGGGKSSLVRAGVLPTITQPGVIEGVGLWRWSIFRPSDAAGDLFQGLTSALCAPGGLEELDDNIPSLAASLQASPESAVEQIREGLSSAARKVAEHERLGRVPETRLALVVDQMEELFTRSGIDDALRDQFVAALAALARSGLVWIIGTMRSDFYPRCGEIPELVVLKEGRGSYDLQPPTLAEIGQMIRFPTRAAGLRFETNPATGENLDDVLLNAAAKDPGALPLLEFTLDELFRQKTEDRVLTFAAYRALGGLEGALARRAEDVFQSLDAATQAALPAVLRSLVTIGEDEGTPATSRRLPVSVVASTAERRALIDAFTASRLLVTDRADNGEAVVRVAHEALLYHWPRLQEWLEQDRDFLRVRARVGEAAARWRQEDRRPDFLLTRGKPLTEAEDILARRRGDLDAETIEFIEASRSHATRAQKARNTSITAAAAAFFVVVSGFSVFSYGQARHAREQAQRAQREALVAQQQTRLAQQQKQLAEQQTTIAQQQRQAAEHQKQAAETQRTMAQQQKQAADLQRQIAQQQKAEAENQRRFAQDQRSEAERQRTEAERQRIYAEQQQRLAAAAQQVAEAQRAAAENNFSQAVMAADTMVSDLAEGIKPIAGTQSTTVRQILDHASNLYTLLLSKKKTPQVLAGKARMLNSFVEIYLKLNDSRTAAADAREAASIFEQLLASDSGNLEYRRGLASSHELLGRVLLRQGYTTRSLMEQQQALRMRQDLAAQHADNADVRADLASSLYYTGNATLSLRDVAGSATMYRQSLETRDQLARQQPHDVRRLQELGESLSALGDATWYSEDVAGAGVYYQRALDTFNDAQQEDPHNTDVQADRGVALEDLAWVAREGHNLKQTGDYLGQAISLAQQYSNLDPHNCNWLGLLLNCEIQQADLAKGTQTEKQSLVEEVAALKSLYSRALALTTEDPANAKSKHDLFTVQSTLATAQTRLVQLGEDPQANLRAARRASETATRLAEELYQLDPSDGVWANQLVSTYAVQGDLAAALGDRAGAARLRLKAGEMNRVIAARKFARTPSDVAAARALADADRFDAAWYKVLADENVSPIANLQSAAALMETATDEYRKALQLQPHDHDADVGLATADVDLGSYLESLAEQKQPSSTNLARAGAAEREAMALFQRLLSTSPQDQDALKGLSTANLFLSVVLRDQGDLAGSQRYFAQSNQIKDQMARLAPAAVSGTTTTISRSDQASQGIFAAESINEIAGATGKARGLYRAEPSLAYASQYAQFAIQLAGLIEKTATPDLLVTAQNLRKLFQQDFQDAQKSGKLTPEQVKEQEPIFKSLDDAYAKLPAPGGAVK